MMRSPLGSFVLAALLSCSVAACSLLQPQPDPTEFFVLTPVAPSTPGEPGTDELLVGVGPIIVPEYLDRTNIVRRFAPNRVAISELEWWAEPLETSLLRVIGDNLAARLGTPAVLRYPWPILMKPAYSVAINFSRFDILGDNRVHLSARWVVRGGQPRRALLTRESSIEKTAASSTTADAVAALSQTLDDLSAEIASAIRTLRVEAPPAQKTPRAR
jgi:uncharacterized lipoprotein YmbA